MSKKKPNKKTKKVAQEKKKKVRKIKKLSKAKDDNSEVDLISVLEEEDPFLDTEETDEIPIEEEKEVVNDAADSLTSLDDNETFSLSSPGSDEGVEGELQTIRSNPAPKAGWSELKKPKFSPGELVVFKTLSEEEAIEFEPYKIICASKDVETYSVRKSRLSHGEIILKGKDLKRAPKNGKPFLTFWEANDPLKVPGIKMSSPSNNKK